VDKSGLDDSESASKKENDEVQLRKNCPLNQCINELSSNLSVKRYSEPARTETIEDSARDSVKVEKIVSEESDNSDKVKINQPDLASKPSHFVTVIEVKEQTVNQTNSSSTTVSTTTSSFKSIRSGYENVIIENNKRNSMEQNETKSQSSFSNYNKDLGGKPTTAKQAAIALLSDAKKKIPPR
jgi:hypothetical protein